MIEKIGVIYQDLNSLGFLCGLRDRLKCKAKFVRPPTHIGKTRDLPRKVAKSAWRCFKKQGVDLVVRITDADQDRWQEVRRKAFAAVPDEASSTWICGVAVNNLEEWMSQDISYLADVLGLPPGELEDPTHRTGRVKRALVQARRDDESASDTVARVVRDAPTEVFRRWLKDDALKELYTDCRAAAARADCDTPNELDQAVAEDE